MATSAFFVPPLPFDLLGAPEDESWDIVGGAAVIVVLVTLNIVGVQEAAKLSIVLAVLDFATQVLLVLLGFFLVFSPTILVDNIHWGLAPTWSNLAIAVPVAMLAYTGVETVSNLAEEAREPARSVPDAYKLVAGAVFAIYLTLPLVALSALPVKEIDGQLTTLLALPPEQGGYANDPILGLVQNLGVEGSLLRVLEIYVGVLAATILFIATNAGVIGASRVTYSMASYRQIPEIFRRLHPKFKTPVLSLVIFAGIAPVLIILPGDVNFVGTLYSFGATLSFTVAHVSLVRLRVKQRDSTEAFYRARPEPRPLGDQLADLRDPRRARDRRLVPRHRGAESDHEMGRARLDRIRAGVLRRLPPAFRPRLAHPEREGAARLRAGARTRIPPAARAGHHRPAFRRRARRRLQPRRRARCEIVALNVLEVPLGRPLDADLGSSRTPRTTSSTRRSRSATRTASACSTASCAPAAPARRSSRRRSGAVPRSS